MNRKAYYEIFWWLVFIFTSALILRLVYERSYLTWLEGDQMVGFSLVHHHWLFFFISAGAWLIANVLAIFAIIKMIRFIIRKEKASLYFIIKNLALIIILLLDQIPYDWWKVITVFFLGAPKHG